MNTYAISLLLQKHEGSLVRTMIPLYVERGESRDEALGKAVEKATGKYPGFGLTDHIVKEVFHETATIES